MNEAIEKETFQIGLYANMVEDLDEINQISTMGQRLVRNIVKIAYENYHDEKMMLKKAEEYTRNLRQCNP